MGQAERRRRSLEAAVDALQAFPNDPELLVRAGTSSVELGRVDEALGYLGRARSLDPRSAKSLRALTDALTTARRCPAVVATAESLSALAPVPTSVYFLVQARLICSGDLELARATIRSAYSQMDRDVLLAYLAVGGDLYWVPDDVDRRRLEALPPSAFSDRAGWAQVQAELRWLRGDSSGMRAYADTARIEFEAHLRGVPDEPQALALRGLALAYLGRHAEAAQDLERARRIHPLSRASNLGVYILEVLARAHMLAGRRAAAMDLLEEILRQPYYITPARLRVDPAYGALRGDPRFERLTAGGPAAR